MAPIKALELFPKREKIKIYTDSIYVKDGITNWIKKWEKNNWKTSNKRDVKNIDLWKSLKNLAESHKIKWEWVKGHSGHPENERADALANIAVYQ